MEGVGGGGSGAPYQACAKKSPLILTTDQRRKLADLGFKIFNDKGEPGLSRIGQRDIIAQATSTTPLEDGSTVEPFSLTEQQASKIKGLWFKSKETLEAFLDVDRGKFIWSKEQREIFYNAAIAACVYNKDGVREREHGGSLRPGVGARIQEAINQACQEKGRDSTFHLDNIPRILLGYFETRAEADQFIEKPIFIKFSNRPFTEEGAPVSTPEGKKKEEWPLLEKEILYKAVMATCTYKYGERVFGTPIEKIQAAIDLECQDHGRTSTFIPHELSRMLTNYFSTKKDADKFVLQKICVQKKEVPLNPTGVLERKRGRLSVKPAELAETEPATKKPTVGHPSEEEGQVGGSSASGEAGGLAAEISEAALAGTDSGSDDEPLFLDWEEEDSLDAYIQGLLDRGISAPFVGAGEPSTDWLSEMSEH